MIITVILFCQISSETMCQFEYWLSNELLNLLSFEASTSIPYSFHFNSIFFSVLVAYRNISAVKNVSLSW